MREDDPERVFECPALVGQLIEQTCNPNRSAPESADTLSQLQRRNGELASLKDQSATPLGEADAAREASCQSSFVTAQMAVETPPDYRPCEGPV